MAKNKFNQYRRNDPKKYSKELLINGFSFLTELGRVLEKLLGDKEYQMFYKLCLNMRCTSTSYTANQLMIIFMIFQ